MYERSRIILKTDVSRVVRGKARNRVLKPEEVRHRVEVVNLPISLVGG